MPGPFQNSSHRFERARYWILFICIDNILKHLVVLDNLIIPFYFLVITSGHLTALMVCRNLQKLDMNQTFKVIFQLVNLFFLVKKHFPL